MKLLLLFILAFPGVSPDTFAQTPAEQLKQMVTQLQTTPNDSALRERIIKLAAAMKPAPAIPEEARRLYVRGNTAYKDAASPDEFATVITRYTEALVIAPWFADAYFNLAKAQEMHKDFDAAIGSLKFFLLTAPPQADARTAQDQIYALEEKRDKLAAAKAEAARQAAAKKAEEAAANTPEAREAALLRKLEGSRFVEHQNDGDGTAILDHIYEIKGGELYMTTRIISMGMSTSVSGYTRPGEYLRGRYSYHDGAFTRTFNGLTMVYRFSTDGQALVRTTSTGYRTEIPRQ